MLFPSFHDLLPLIEQDKMSVALVNGASGGIGSQFVRHLLRDTNMAVVATSRRGADAKAGLLEGAKLDHRAQDRLTCLEIDVLQEDSIAEAAKAYQKQFGKGTLRLMLNAPGIASCLILYFNVS